MNNETLNELERVESLASKLDTWIGDGEFEPSSLKRAQLSLNKAAEILLGDDEPDRNFYIIYECQALIHWINGEEDLALELVKSAVDVKGDRELRTINGRALSTRLSVDKENNILKGWQALFVADALLLLSFLSYSIPNMLAFITLVIAVIVGVVNLAKNRTDKIGFDLAMTAIATMIYAVLSASAYSAAFPG